MAWVEPLDFERIFVNTFAGSLEIFTFLSFIAIAAGAGFFKMRNSIALLMLLLFTVIMSNFIGNGYFIVITLLSSLITFYSISRLMSW